MCLRTVHTRGCERHGQMRPFCALTGCCRVSQIASFSMSVSCVLRCLCDQYRVCSLFKAVLLSLRKAGGWRLSWVGRAAARPTHTLRSVCKLSSRCAFCMARNTFKRRRCCITLSFCCCSMSAVCNRCWLEGEDAKLKTSP